MSYEERLEDTQDEIEDEITTDRNNNRAILKHVLQDNPTHASEIEEAADDLSDYNYLIEEPLEWYNVNTGAVLGDMNYKIKVIDEAVEDYYNSDDDGLSLADVINRRFESADDFVPQR